MAKRKTKDLHIRIKDVTAARYAQAMAILKDESVADYVTGLINRDAAIYGLKLVMDRKVEEIVPVDDSAVDKLLDDLPPQPVEPAR